MQRRSFLRGIGAILGLGAMKPMMAREAVRKAVAAPTVKLGLITYVSVLSAGSGYVNPPIVTFHDSAGFGGCVTYSAPAGWK